MNQGFTMRELQHKAKRNLVFVLVAIFSASIFMMLMNPYPPLRNAIWPLLGVAASFGIASGRAWLKSKYILGEYASLLSNAEMLREAGKKEEALEIFEFLLGAANDEFIEHNSLVSKTAELFRELNPG